MAITPALGSLPVTPTASKTAVPGAFVDLRTQSWAQQYMPELMEAEAEVFGNRTISGFLSQVGAEEAMASDTVVWSEQGRLHISFEASFANGTALAADQLTVPSGHGIRVNDTVVLNQAGVGTLKCLVTDVAATTIDCLPYTQATMDSSASGAITFVTGTAVKGFVYGSEYKKGTSGRDEGLEPGFRSLSNRPVIIKDLYEVTGSDASQIGWVEVSGEDGQNGYLWYLKASGDTMTRFADYCEMVCIEGELNTTSGTGTVGAELGAVSGTQGLFAAIEERGNVSSINWATDGSSTVLAEFDAILKRFDSQGAIEENMMFLNRDASLTIDDMLAGMNSYGGNGTSYGVFNNSEDMALNLGFTGFRRGSYDFYKSDWKYLNDQSTRGQFQDIDGAIIPAGVSSVYDQVLGRNLKRPFLHIRYRASQTESRKMKTWVTGSVGAVSDSLDAMEVHYLSERCLVTQGANNFMLLK